MRELAIKEAKKNDGIVVVVGLPTWEVDKSYKHYAIVTDDLIQYVGYISDDQCIECNGFDKIESMDIEKIYKCDYKYLVEIIRYGWDKLDNLMKYDSTRIKLIKVKE